MSRLRSEPPAPVKSLGELLALAQALEREAAERYGELATQMEQVQLPEVAEVFRHLAAEERGHAERVEDWSHSELGAPPNPELIRWQPPATFDEEAAQEIGSSHLASAYRALSMAVRNEESAFALWSYIVAQAETPEIREAAERMAVEELRHAALLRRERRRAFHVERRRSESAEGSSARLPPMEEAAQGELRLQMLLRSLAGSGALTRQSAEELRRLADDPLGVISTNPEAPGEVANQGDQVRTVLALSERSIELYLDAAERALDESEVRLAQSLAGRAMVRTVALRRIVGGA